jgi:hypothetical protein
MSATQNPQALARYRDAVADQMKAGEWFGDIEGTIDEAAELTTHEKAALWLFAFSLRDRDEQQREARAQLAALQLAGGPMGEQARPRQQAPVLHAVFNGQWGAERGGRRNGRGRVGSRDTGAADRAHPLEFDENGFPVAQRSAGFGERVDRLLNAV